VSIVAGNASEDPTLHAPADDRRFVEVVGERIALLGHESGVFECWMWPIKLCHDLRWRVRRIGDGETAPDDDLRREVTVTPGGLTLETRSNRFTLTGELFAARERRALVLLFDLEADVPIELEFSFRCDFRPMWPAGMGGQIGAPDPETPAFLLTEELGRFAALIGGPTARLIAGGRDHALPVDPVRMRMTIEPGKRAVFVIAGAQLDPPPLSEEARLGLGQSATGFARAEEVVAAAREEWREGVEGWERERKEVEAHWSRFLATTTTFSCPDPAHEEAFLWAKIAIERAWVRVDGIGRGLVAGLATSRGSERPGYGWFFDGDALIASRAMVGTGDFDGAREVLRFAASHQRADGKLMHELTLSAGLCRWLEDYPYAYYKGINAADFVISLERYLRASGDLDLGRELWDSVEAALGWCESCTDEQGRITNRRAGIAAVEAGPLSDAIESEVFLHGAWLGALRAGEGIAGKLDRPDAAARYRDWRTRAEAGFEGFASPETGRYGFALLKGGERCDDDSAYLGYPLALGFGEEARALISAMHLNDPALTGDCGSRMFSMRSAVYDPEHYNTGAVFPFLTSYVSLALFRHGLAPAAHQLHASQVALTGFGALGMIEEHLRGDRAEIPERGVPHQIFSSYAIPEVTLRGVFGIELAATERRLDLCPSMPPNWGSARLERLCVGETRLDLEFSRGREERGASSLRLELRLREGPSLTIGLGLMLPPLSSIERARVQGEEIEIEATPRASGAVVVGWPDRELVDHLAFEVQVKMGPDLLFPAEPPSRGEASREPRLVGLSVEDGILTWRIAGLAGSRSTLATFVDFEIDVEGAERREDGALEVSFPADAPGSFTTTDVRVSRR
jgi:hypothetical protein